MDYDKKPAYSMWDANLGEIIISPESLREDAERYRLPARLALGRVCTAEMFEQDRKRILSRPLP